MGSDIQLARGFTVAELIMVVVVIGILATISFGAYRSMKADSATKSCETKLIALQAAFNSCVMEKGLSYCLDSSSAQPFLNSIALGDLKYLSCPADLDSPEKKDGAHISYGYNSILNGLSTKDYQQVPSDLIIIGDCKSAAFATDKDLSALEMRHVKYKPSGGNTLIALAITKASRVNQGKLIKRITAENKACHEAYQKCLTNWFAVNKGRDTFLSNCYSDCIPAPACYGDYN